MNEFEHAERSEPTLVTQDEASQMVELWAHSANSSASGHTDLRAVAEALGISADEAAALLARVREESPAVVKDDPGVFAATILVFLILSLAFATASAFVLTLELLDGHSFESRNALALLGSLIWLTLWAILYRRPIARGLTDAARRLRQSRD